MLTKFVPLIPSYQNFVINSFLKSYRGVHSSLQNAEYYHTYSQLILDYLGRFETLLAVNAKDPDQIFGWILTDSTTNTLVYIYVKYPLRGMNIANDLMLNSELNWDEQVYARFLTPVGQKIARNLNIIHSELTI